MEDASSAYLHINTSAHRRFFLIGFMGSGKTHWGKKWAELTGFQFHDIDEVVEAEQGKTAAEIFAEDGEDFFRELETTALRRFADKRNVIVACGGGTACYNDNVSWMNQHGTSIYLRSSCKKILQRLTTEKEKRPLIKSLRDEELLFYITEKIKEREYFYNQAKVILDVDDLPENYIPACLAV